MDYVWMIVGVVFVLAMWTIFYFAFSGIDEASDTYYAPLGRRHALVSKLVESAKGGATDGCGTLEAVVQALKWTTLARGLSQTGQTEHALSSALRELFAHANADPTLKANQDFQVLQAKILEIEPEISGVLRYCTEPNRGAKWF